MCQEQLRERQVMKAGSSINESSFSDDRFPPRMILDSPSKREWGGKWLVQLNCVQLYFQWGAFQSLYRD